MRVSGKLWVPLLLALSPTTILAKPTAQDQTIHHDDKTRIDQGSGNDTATKGKAIGDESNSYEEEYERRIQAWAHPQPQAVRKMGFDESEKFYMQYWNFEDAGKRSQQTQFGTSGLEELATEIEDTQAPSIGLSRRGREPEVVDEAYRNSSTCHAFNPPLLLHTTELQQPLEASSADDHWFLLPALLLPKRALSSSLDKRDFSCPANTNACTGISQPNACCATGETCVNITDTGLGNVGCCPKGQDCAGSVSVCDTALGYSSCPGFPGGGCCIPDFVCAGVGCKLFSPTLIC
jgi:hypothetical protein